VAGTLERLAAGGELGSARALRVELAERSVRVRHALEVYTTGASEVTEAGGGPVMPAVGVPAQVSFLVVDDVAATRRFVRAALDTVISFVVVGEAGTGPQAIELAASLQPDLVLLDLELGDTDAVDILPDLIRVAPATRVVILSRHAAADGPAISAAGLIGYITKGLKASDLVDQIGSLIGRPLVVKPRAATIAVAVRPDLCRAVVFDPDPLTRRTINWVLAESNVQIISEVNATDNVADVIFSAVKLVRPGLVVLGGASHAYGARLISTLRPVAPDAVFINYASDVPLELTGEGSWLHVVLRGDVERLRSCMRDVMAGQK
jgi:CheY-like chemotaxis protein